MPPTARLLFYEKEHVLRDQKKKREKKEFHMKAKANEIVKHG